MSEIHLSRNWKQTLTTSKMKPFAMQVSLWDLLFYTEENKVYPRYSTNIDEWKCKGFSLPHNTIVFDNNIYIKPITSKGRRIINQSEEENPNDPTLTTFDKWSKLGFDICLPWFDPRTKPLYLTKENYKEYIQGDEDFEDFLKRFKPKPLQKNDYYYTADQPQNHALGYKVWNKDSALQPQYSVDFHKKSILTEETNQELSWKTYGDPWYVSIEEDYDFFYINNETQLRQIGTINSDIILCNKDISFEGRFLLPESNLSAYNQICLNYRSPRVWRNLLEYYNLSKLKFELEAFFEETKTIKISPIMTFLLKNCFVWIKCAFFADYIDYKDFNQALNEEAEVIHKNLILGKGDFKRYNKLFSEHLISPIDFARNTRPYFPNTTPVKDLLAPEMVSIGNNYKEVIKELIQDSLNPDTKIGYIPIEPFENYGNGYKNSTTSLPITADTPPIWFDPDSRKTENDYNDIPIIMPKKGNLITSGRVISPTIDELWQAFKELAAGTKKSGSEQEDIGGYPINKIENPNDTRLKLKKHKFKTLNGVEAIGDPTNIILQSNDENNIFYRVQSWVSDPDFIQYNVYKEIKDISKEICKFCSIQNIEDIVKNPEKYLPSNTIPSLRELEALVKGLRWNLIYYIKFLQTSAVYIGSTGQHNSDDKPYNFASGTAYLLHKDKTFTNSTVYDERKNRDIEIDFGIGLGKITPEMFGENQDIVPPHTVFMSAAGTWQSVSQCMNVRIRDDEDW